MSHDPGSFEGKPSEDAALDAADTGLKIRVSLVQFHPGHRMSVLAPTPPERMVDAKGRPYFLWDEDITVDVFRSRLVDSVRLDAESTVVDGR